MSIFSIFKKKELVEKQPRTPYILNYGQATPPDRNLQGYLNAYSEVAWLFAVVSRIAEGVSEAKWRLYKVDAKGDRTMIYNHAILNSLDFANPFQTFQEFIEMHQVYMGLTGECFWIINKNKNGEPAEYWIAPPERVSVVPSKKDFIAGYVYQIGSEKIPLAREEVIHHKLPNPLNPYRGLGPVQALAIDLDSELYAGKWNRNFFYNSARPDGILGFEGTLSEEQFDRLKKQWGERHQGTANAHKVALLEGGGKYQQISFNAKDMDFRALRMLNRDNILGVYGMPLSVMGITENVNKANAEAGDYTFARWIVKPRLNRIRNKLNEQLLPMFRNSKGLELDFDEVVPQTTEQKMAQADSGIRAGYMSINEARQLQGLDPLDEAVGDVLLIPLNLVPMSIDETLEQYSSIDETDEPIAEPTGEITDHTNVTGDAAENIAEGAKLNGIQIQAAVQVLRDFIAGNLPDTVALELLVAVGIDRERAQEMISACTGFEPADPAFDPTKPTQPPETPPTEVPPTEPPPVEPSKDVKKKLTPEWKEAYWRGYVTRAEAYERKMITGLKSMFNKQETEAISKLNAGSKVLLDVPEAKVAYTKVAEPILLDLFQQSAQNGSELIAPKPVHTGKDAPQDYPVSPGALKWLRTRLGWAAESISAETARMLEQALLAGYEAGEDIPTIAKRVKSVFADCDRRRSVLISRTETIGASAQGTIEGYRDSGVVEQAEFLAAIDERTCEDCDAMNEEVFNLDDTGGIIPIHPDCRCCWIPVVE